MKCDAAKILLAQSAYEKVAQEEGERLEDHLLRCPSCQSARSAFAELAESLPKGDGMPADVFFTRQRNAIMARLSTGESENVWRTAFWERRWRLAPAFLGAAALALWMVRPARPPVSQGMEVVQNMEMLEHLDLLEDWVEMDSHGRA